MYTYHKEDTKFLYVFSFNFILYWNYFTYIFSLSIQTNFYIFQIYLYLYVNEIPNFGVTLSLSSFMFIWPT